MTASEAEYVLADLAIRLGAARVAGWSHAEQELSAAAAAAVAPGSGSGCFGRPGSPDWPGWVGWCGCFGWDCRDCRDGRAERDGKGGRDGVTGRAERGDRGDRDCRDGGAERDGRGHGDCRVGGAERDGRGGDGDCRDGRAEQDGRGDEDCRDGGAERDGKGGRDGVAGLRARIRAGEDLLGQAFCRIRPPEQRRGAGQIFTPAAVVDSMISWGGRTLTPARVVDPGAGSARFLVAAGRRWPEAELVGLETDPLAALIGRATLAAAGMAGRATIEVADYRTVRLPAATGRTLFLGNPPYVRHHQVPAPWKNWFRDTAARLGVPASGLAGLHAHFFLATALHAAPGDAGALVTAAEWLDVNYGGLIRALLLGPLGGESIHLLDPAAAVFPDAAATSAITCFRPGSTPRAIRLRQVAGVTGLGGLAGGTPVPVTVLRSASRWRPLAVRPPGPRRRPEGLVELGELCRVHRGQVTGANRVWITNGADSGLPARFLFPAVTRASELFRAGNALASPTALRRIIDLPADLRALPAGELVQVTAFLDRARAAGAAESYVARHRNPWWRVRLAEPAPILASYMARRPPAFVRNLAAARHVNIAHGLYPRDPLPPAALDGLAAYLRSSVTAGQGRLYAGGLAKFEPGDMERLLVPAPSLLDRQIQPWYHMRDSQDE